MALIKCSKCGKEFSDKALACPNCNCSIYETQRNNIKNNSDGNTISALIKALSWFVIITGFIIGFISYGFNEDVGQMLTICLTYGVCSIGGFALAEIIQLLHDIRNILYRNK